MTSYGCHHRHHHWGTANLSHLPREAGQAFLAGIRRQRGRGRRRNQPPEIKSPEKASPVAGVWVSTQSSRTQILPEKPTPALLLGAARAGPALPCSPSPPWHSRRLAKRTPTSHPSDAISWPKPFWSLHCGHSIPSLDRGCLPPDRGQKKTMKPPTPSAEARWRGWEARRPRPPEGRSGIKDGVSPWCKAPSTAPLRKPWSHLGWRS